MNLEENIVNQVFTEVEGGINGNLNKLTVKCFDSVNNKFSMDCDGNLVVNSITTRVKDAPQEQPISVDKIYPIGSIYLSLNATNPATLFGGTWEQISQGRTLVGVDPSDPDFNIPKKAAGEKYHTLNLNEIPPHTHTYETQPWLWAQRDITGPTSIKPAENYTCSSVIGTTSSAGQGWGHNNMQPYFTCYMWHRIA